MGSHRRSLGRRGGSGEVAAGLVALMAGALAFRIRVHDAIAFLLADGVLLVLAVVTATLTG